MMKESIDEFIKQFFTTLPPELHHLKQEIEKGLRQGLNFTLQKLDLVTREEFDIQTQVLVRSREKLEKLEKKIAQLENLHQTGFLDDTE